MSPVLLITRPEPGGRDFLDRLALAPGSAEVIDAPLLALAPEGPLPDLAGQWPIFTSPGAVAAFRALGGRGSGPAYAVGDATAAAARAAGFAPRSAAGDAAALLALIRAEAPTAPLLHLRGRHAAGALAARLAAAGIAAREAVIYDQAMRPLGPRARAALAGPRPVVAPLFSPRTARAFALYAPFGAEVLVAAMSPAVAAALGSAVPRCATAARPDAAAMAALTARLLVEAAALEGRKGAE
ncbi:uroporphyrinogen-III synthase [Roseivivax sp. CAU 1761]